MADPARSIAPNRSRMVLSQVELDVFISTGLFRWKQIPNFVWEMEEN